MWHGIDATSFDPAVGSTTPQPVDHDAAALFFFQALSNSRTQHSSQFVPFLSKRAARTAPDEVQSDAMPIRILILATAFAALIPAQQKKVLVQGLTPDEVKALQQAEPRANVVAVTAQSIMQQVSDADAIMGTITPEMVRAGKKLRWFQTYSAGVEPYLVTSGSNDLRDSQITVTNCKIIQGPEIADHAFALLLTLTRGLHRVVANRAQENWDPKNYEAIELPGKTALIIGVGGIGMQIAARAHGFGMRVIGIDPKDIPFSPFISKVVKPDQIDEVMPDADVVFISAPHTKESERMVGPRQFDLMKKNSYFIAVSRGKVYDMPSLVKALDSKKLAGAGVDVTDPEPLPKGHALWKFENAIVTPHIATRSDRVQERRMAVLKDNLKRFVDGRPLVNVIDKEKQY